MHLEMHLRPPPGTAEHEAPARRPRLRRPSPRLSRAASSARLKLPEEGLCPAVWGQLTERMLTPGSM